MQIVELRFALSDESDQTPYPTDGKAMGVMITPTLTISSDGAREIRFRVAFEPENPNRKPQPLRETLAPVFPNGWSAGDPVPEAAVSSDLTE